MNIRTFHEAPKSVFADVQNMTSGDYCLVHLLEEDPEYLQLFKDAKKKGREVILDNSIFELGTAFDADRFAYWIKELEPDWYIIPDVLENTLLTCNQAFDWISKYRDLPGKKIGVIQGKTFQELRTCYEYLDKNIEVDMIAISFDYSYYLKAFPHPNKYVSWMIGRVQLLGELVSQGVINVNKKHHLLGNSLPIEGKFYKDYDWIYSVDTSNPIVHAIKGIAYEDNFGLYSKESQKLVELINTPANQIEMYTLAHNIQEFYKYWNERQF